MNAELTAEGGPACVALDSMLGIKEVGLTEMGKVFKSSSYSPA